MKILAMIHFYFWLSWQGLGFKDSEPNFYQIDCRIYNEMAELVAAYPGFTCAFAGNGEWLSLEEHTLKLYDSKNIVKYVFPGYVHHELRFSRDESRIYFLTSIIKKWKGVDTRFDVINVADRNGKLLASWSLADHIPELIRDLHLENFLHVMPFKITRNTLPVDVYFEFSHLNAISEIPPNILEPVLPYMKRGNLLVTFNGIGGVIIFDPLLKKIEHIFDNRFLELGEYGYHDAQILPNGHLLLYKNINNAGPEEYTTINEYDILLKRKAWTFRLQEPNFKLNKINGTVQLLNNGNLVLSDNSFGGRVLEMNRSGEILWQKFNERRDEETGLPVMVYRAKKIAADDFFKNNITGATLR